MAICLDIECTPDFSILEIPGAQEWLTAQAKKRDMNEAQYCQLCPPLAKVYCIGVNWDSAISASEIYYNVEFGAGEPAFNFESTGRKSLCPAPVMVTTTPCSDEREVLTQFANAMNKAWDFGTSIVTYNGRGYDFLVLYHRMRRAKVECRAIEVALRERRWDHQNSDDLQDAVTFDGVGGRWPLAAYALGHRLHFSKEDIDGANLLPALQEGRVDDVLRYNAGDVECTRQLWLHLRKVNHA